MRTTLAVMRCTNVAAVPSETITDLVESARAVLRPGRRVVLGLTGAPGAGKTTLAETLVSALGEQAALLPMDGFHLADAQLDRLGLRGRKGAPETFDVDGYVATLARLRATVTGPVYAPGFERDLEQPLAAALVVLPEARLVVTEGNYLLGDGGGWERVRPLLDEAWYVEAPEDLRRRRLEQRHVVFGKTPPEAAAWVASVDEPNATLVASCKHRADRVVRL